MKRLVMLVLLAGVLWGQNPETAVFPAAVATDEDLLVEKDSAWSVLDGAIDDSTLTVVVVTGSRFIAPSIVKIDQEMLKICKIATNAFTVCTSGRGYAGTTAATHASGALIENIPAAKPQNQMRVEIKAMQEALGANLANVVKQTEISVSGTPNSVAKRDASGNLVAHGYSTDSTDPFSDDVLNQTGALAAASAINRTRYGFTPDGVFASRTYGAAERPYAYLDLLDDYEPALGNPDADGKVLSSTAAGVRSWVAQTGGPTSGDSRATKLAGYGVGKENAATALLDADLTNHAFAVNNADSKVLTEASCISDAGSQVVTVKIGSTTLFSITCRAPADYSRSTTDGSTGYINAAGMASTAVAGGAMLDLSGTANTTTKSIALHVYGGYSTRVGAVEAGEENAEAALVTADLTRHAFAVNDASAKTLTEATCISDAGDQTVVVKVGATTKLTIHCVAPASYSRSTTDGTTGYLNAAAITDTAIAAGAMLDLSGTANETTKDVKLHIWGTVN